MKRIALCIAFVLGITSPAFADGPVTIPALVDAGVQEGSGSAGSGSAATTTTTQVTVTTGPADKLHNPVDDPLAALSDIREAKKQGWAFAILASVIMLVAGLARASVRWPNAPLLSTIAKHKTVIFVVTCLGAAAGAAFNALALGGSMYSVLLAGGGAALLFINAGGPPKQAQA